MHKVIFKLNKPVFLNKGVRVALVVHRIITKILKHFFFIIQINFLSTPNKLRKTDNTKTMQVGGPRGWFEKLGGSSTYKKLRTTVINHLFTEPDDFKSALYLGYTCESRCWDLPCFRAPGAVTQYNTQHIRPNKSRGLARSHCVSACTVSW